MKKTDGPVSGVIRIAGEKINFAVARPEASGLRKFRGFIIKRGGALLKPPRVFYRGNPYDFENELRKIVAQKVILENRGLLLHASGAAVQSRGSGGKNRRRRRCGGRRAAALFCGRSSTGKSTVAALFSPGDVLSDELVAVVRRGALWRAFATPFRGTLSKPGRDINAPLRGIFFLKKSRRWSIKPLSPGETFRRLLKNTLLPDEWFCRKLEKAAVKNAASLIKSGKAQAAELSFSLKDLGRIKKLVGRRSKTL